MRDMTRLLLVTTFLSGLVAAPALAQEYPQPADDAAVVAVEQESSSDVVAEMQIFLPEPVTGASAIATAMGNTSAAHVATGDVDYDATQSQTGKVSAYTAIVGGPVYGGPAETYTTAYGNSASSSTTYGTTFHRLNQVSDADVSASSDIYLDGADDVTATTTAAANVSSLSSSNGENRGFQEQRGNADVSASTYADLCCNNGSVSLASVASGNTVSSYGSTSTSYNGAVQVMDFDTKVSASTEAKLQSGTSVNTSATAAANSFTVNNEWGFATLGRDGSELFQANGADVDATATVELGTWTGTSGSIAYGVGNSALISNIGSDTSLFANQENFGDITSYASLNGSSSDGSDGYVSSTAMGNALTATLCYTCSEDGVLTGRATQLNSADISAYGVATVNSAGYVQGAATAVGNSATYQSFGTN